MDNTKKKILEAAAEIFVAQGFSGSSISEIARKAGVNQSLIYHHIGSKKDLWKEVKRNLLGGFKEEVITHKNFYEWLSFIIDQRILIYENPHILRLAQWQMLEDAEDIIGGDKVAPLEWINSIRLLQQDMQIVNTYPADLIAVYIYSLINGLLMNALSIFTNDPDKKNKYLNMIKEEIFQSFGTKK